MASGIGRDKGGGNLWAASDSPISEHLGLTVWLAENGK